MGVKLIQTVGGVRNGMGKGHKVNWVMCLQYKVVIHCFPTVTVVDSLVFDGLFHSPAISVFAGASGTGDCPGQS